VVGPSVLDPLTQLARASIGTLRSPRRHVALALVGLAWIGALLLARYGTGRARVGAAAAMVASILAAVAWSAFERWRMRSPAGVVRTLARPVDRERSERVLRALSLIATDGGPSDAGTSPDLANLYVARAMAWLPAERISARTSRLATRLRSLALGLAIALVGVAFANTWPVLEGADVLIARSGVAPFAMRWLDQAQVVARPPDYLHEPERTVLDVQAVPVLAAPYGTLVTVRGNPTRPSRHLFLSDSSTEVPFVEDGSGGLVARWPLVESTSLHVVARFGGVAIPEPSAISLRSIPDDPPSVVLEGAPRQVNLVDEGQDDIPVKWVATDDHGLREVELVLRSGVREERRVLVRLDGETRSESGGMLLKLRDPFLKMSHAPVQVTVEAKDNDPLLGPKWGSSAAIMLLPPQVGEPEALRIDGLRRLRDALVDSLAWRLTHDMPVQAAARKDLAAEDKRRADADDDRLQEVLREAYAGVRIPSRLRAMIVAQQQKTRRAIDAEMRAAAVTSHSEVVRATERFALVVDAVIRGLAFRDAREAARQLADVADDLAAGAIQMQDEAADSRSRGETRMGAATMVLEGGARSLKRLGMLGRDLGEIVVADLARVTRARTMPDLVHAELAARDLAARLREPDPSFGSRGGSRSSGRAGGEAGGARGTPGEDEEDSGDEVDQAEQAAAQELERLAQDHAGQMAKTEQALSGATSDDELRAMRDEAQGHAEAVRQAVGALPSVGMGSDSWTSKGAAARELGEQMARSLEQAHLDEAAQSGRSALGALDEAKRMLQRGGWLEDPNGARLRLVEETRRKVEAEEKWAEQALEAMRKRAAERARGPLEQGADEEGKLAERAEELGQRSREQGSLPQQAVESIEDANRAARRAAQALKQGDADRGLQLQREAQRDLESARSQLEGEEGEPQGPQDGNQTTPSPGRVDIPNSPPDLGRPQEFRRRVVRGLGQPSGGALKDAVKRYAEGLLR
jgi:hypothetical protein